MRTLGQWMGKLRRMASEFQGQFHEAMREAELADLKKQVDEMTTQAQSYANFDPVSEVRKEFESTQQQVESAISGQAPTDTPPTDTAPADASSSATVAAEPTIAPSAETPRIEAPAVEAPNPGAPSTEAPSGSAASDAVKHDAEGKPA